MRASVPPVSMYIHTTTTIHPPPPLSPTHSTHLRGVPPQRVHRPGMHPRDGQDAATAAAATATGGAQVNDADVAVVAGEGQAGGVVVIAVGVRGEAHALDDGVLEVLFGGGVGCGCVYVGGG
jgi:hypothetical protein